MKPQGMWTVGKYVDAVLSRVEPLLGSLLSTSRAVRFWSLLHVSNVFHARLHRRLHSLVVSTNQEQSQFYEMEIQPRGSRCEQVYIDFQIQPTSSYSLAERQTHLREVILIRYQGLS